MSRGKTENHYLSEYVPADTFMIRGPLLSLHVLQDVRSYEHLDEILKKYYTNPIVSEALFLASPELYRLANRWINNADGQGQNSHKLKLSLLKYLLRMSSRCTPFGMFAGISSGIFGPATKIKISPLSEHSLKLRPDMQYLCTMAGKLTKDHAIREVIRFYPNNSLTITGEEYRYVEYSTDKDGIRKYQLQKTPITNELQKVLNKAIHGCSVKDLADEITGNEIDKQPARAYLNALIDNQVLISSFEPVVSGRPYLDDLLEQIRNLDIQHEIGLQLQGIGQLINKLEKREHGSRIELLNSFIEVAQSSDDRLSERSLIQADLKLSFEHNELSEQIRQDLTEMLPLLKKLARPQKPYLLEKFKESFQRRYHSKEIPLLLALDAEAGPGYLDEDRNSNASSLLNGLLIPLERPADESIIWGEPDSFLHRKLNCAMMAGERSINISEEELNALADNNIDLPISFSVMTRILGPKDGNSSQNMIQIDSVGGSSAANLAGRFCYLDERLNDAVREIARTEQKIMGDEILAEIIHLPQQRTGNILMRPVFRDYEIPYLAREAVGDEYRISLDDLMVSVADDTVRLRSKRLDKYIIPRMSNAHNYSMASLPVYRFLCDLQYQGICSNPGFSWGSVARVSQFLPRVMYKNLILHPSKWNLPVKEFIKFKEAKNTGEQLSSIRELRSKYSIPDEILLCEGDNELWINLENHHCLNLLQNEIRGLDQVVFQEYLNEQEEALIKGEGGEFANEVVFFMHKSTD